VTRVRARFEHQPLCTDTKVASPSIKYPTVSIIYILGITYSLTLDALSSHFFLNPPWQSISLFTCFLFLFFTRRNVSYGSEYTGFYDCFQSSCLCNKIDNIKFYINLEVCQQNGYE